MRTTGSTTEVAVVIGGCDKGPPFRPTAAEFDLAEDIEYILLNAPASQRPSIAGLIATRVAQYRGELAQCLTNVTRERDEARRALAALRAEGWPWP